MTQKIYRFNFRERRGIIFLKADKSYDDLKLSRGEEGLPESFEFYIYKGTTYHTHAYLPDPGNIAISSKFREVLITNQITGWTSFPINIRDSNFDYYFLQTLGRSGKIYKPSNTGWVNGINIDMSKWDGSDFFLSNDRGFGTLFFTEKVRELLLKNKFFSEREMIDIAASEWYYS